MFMFMSHLGFLITILYHLFSFALDWLAKFRDLLWTNLGINLQNIMARKLTPD